MASRNAPELNDSIHEYFCCEQGGHNPDNPCSRSEIGDLSDFCLKIVLYILMALFPVVNLIYAVNVQELKELWKKIVSEYHCNTDNATECYTLVIVFYVYPIPVCRL